MWDDRLSLTDMAKDNIKLVSQDLRPVNYAFYRAGPRAQELKEMEIDRMLLINVIQPAYS